MQQSWTEEKSKFYLEKYKRMGNIEQNIYIIEFFRSFDSKYEPPRDHETPMIKNKKLTSAQSRPRGMTEL